MDTDKKKWQSLTRTMDIPEIRREPTKANLGWFFRNVYIRNSAHPNIIVAWDLAKKLDKVL